MRRGLALAVGGYLLLLFASHAVRFFAPPAADPGDASFANLEVPALGSEAVRVAYRDSGESSRPVLLLLHGSPGRGKNFGGVEQLLARQFRVVIPDLPGFGASQQKVDDYSIEAHASACLRLLDHLKIPRAHWVGFSMGGGVALHAAAEASDRVSSVVLLSSIGAQEYELLGDYALNHLVHGAQWLGIAGANGLLPHFGALDRFPLNRAYARNFYDTDQRPLRGILEGLVQPTLILHSETDGLVSPRAAREHHRIVPQSEIVWVPGGHFALFRQPGKVQAAIADFVTRAESGGGLTRKDASAERKRAAARPFRTGDAGPKGWMAVMAFGLLVLIATLVSEDLTCIGVGLLIARGHVSFALGAAACVVGLWLGDLLLYLGGRFARGSVARWLGKKASVPSWRVSNLRRGSWAIIASRFLPGARLPLYVGAGASGFPFLRFAALLLLAALLWTPLLVGASVLLGDWLGDHMGRFRGNLLALLVIAAAILLFATRIAPRLLSHRGRRLLYGSWQRLRRWEFWPSWAVYPPVVLWILWLALRHRSLRIVTAVNPGMEGGGLVGESKWQILEPLQRERPDLVAKTCLLDPAAALAQTRAFQESLPEPYPLVIKPDEGERGFGVTIVRNASELSTVTKDMTQPNLAQAYVPGVEFGVFYERHPDAERGRIFSITEKLMIHVTGDGSKTLETLILDDPRAVCLAECHFRKHVARLDWIPEAGEIVQLTELGTHSRGSLFLDGAPLETDALLESVEAASRTLPGFFFGRFDLRSPDTESFQRGEFEIVELNGLTSEATHMYDPRYGLFHAVGVLCDQWRRAFVIAAANRSGGASPAPWSQLYGLWRKHRGRGPAPSPAARDAVLSESLPYE